MMEIETGELLGLYKELLNSSFLKFEEISAMKNVMGVYVIYGVNEEVLYVGSTNKFHIRFGTDLKHESTHTLIRKWLKTGKFKNREDAVSYLKGVCKFRIIGCSPKRKIEALEHIAIWFLNPIYNANYLSPEDEQMSLPPAGTNLTSR